MKILPCGDQAILVELHSPGQVQAVHAALTRLAHPGILDLVPAAQTVLLSLDTRKISPADARALVMDLRIDDTRAEYDGAVVDIPVSYDGADLDELARRNGLSREELIDWHTSTVWQASFGGFAPGFMYLAPKNPEDGIDVARRTTPRTSIPAGSVAVAGTFSAVYPKPSPGGWQLLGTTTSTMWDLHRPQPSLILPGDVVRFYQVVNS